MNDIKKKTRRAPIKKSQEPDLSFLEEEKPADVQEINQPQHLTYKLGSVFKQRTVIEAVVAVLLFGSGLVLGMQFATEPEPAKVVTAPPAEMQQVAGERDQLFPQGVYHRLELVSGDIYYSLITDSDSEFYKLTNVFYTIEESTTEDELPKITLAMYEEADDQPAGELLLPYGQVKAVSQLSSQSSIVVAIDQYLASQQAESLAEEEISEKIDE